MSPSRWLCSHLHIPLVQAERAWAYAMDLKGQLEDAPAAAAPKRQHLVRRLSKAARHAGELVALASARCDARTQVGPGGGAGHSARGRGCRQEARVVLWGSPPPPAARAGSPPSLPLLQPVQLEAEAYSLWMAGSVLLEKESDWEGALARFLRAQ